MKVAVFKSTRSGKIESDINDFISMNNYEIIDIKWAASNEWFSALVMYK